MLVKVNEDYKVENEKLKEELKTLHTNCPSGQYNERQDSVACNNSVT